MLITAPLIAWAGTLYGAYAWGTSTGAPDIWQATLCSMSQEDFQDASRALDKIITIEGVSLPLRAWEREYSDSTLTYVKALAEEAAFQEQRRERTLELIVESCYED